MCGTRRLVFVYLIELGAGLSGHTIAVLGLGFGAAD